MCFTTVYAPAPPLSKNGYSGKKQNDDGQKAEDKIGPQAKG